MNPFNKTTTLPPKGLAGRFLFRSERVLDGDLGECARTGEAKGARWKRVNGGGHLAIWDNWFFRPNVEYFSDKAGNYLCPITENNDKYKLNENTKLYELDEPAYNHVKYLPPIIKKEIYTNVLKDDFDCLVEST